MLVAGGFVFTADRVARLDDGGLFPWISVWRASGDLALPAAQAEAWLGEVLSLPAAPRLELPAGAGLRRDGGGPAPAAPGARRQDALRGRAPGLSSLVRLRRRRRSREPGRAGRVPARPAAPGAPRPRRRARPCGASSRAGRCAGRPSTWPRPSGPAWSSRRAASPAPWPRCSRRAGTSRPRASAIAAPAASISKSARAWTGSSCAGGSTSTGIVVALPELLAALRRGENTVRLGDGTYGVLPEEWLRRVAPLAGFGQAEGADLRFTRAQVGLLDALLAAQPEVTCDETFARARAELQRFEGIRPAEAPADFVGHAAPVPARRARLAPLPRALRLRRLPGRRHGPRQDHQVLALLDARRERRAQRSPGPERPARRWSWCRARWSSTGSRRRRASPRSSACSITPARAGSRRASTSTTTTWSSRPTARCAAMPRPSRERRFDYAILDEAQAIKNASTESAKAARLLQRRSSPGAHRHADREPPRRAVEPVRVPQPGHARHGERLPGSSAAACAIPTSPRAGCSRAPLRPFILRAHQGAGGARPAAKTRADALLRAGAGPARELYDELRRHYRQTLLGRLEREGMASDRRSTCWRRCCACARRPATPA